MKLEIPSTYVSEFVRPKKRSVEKAVMQSKFEVDIREIDPADAPVAHVLGEAWPDESEAYQPGYLPFGMVDGKPVEVRVVDGSYWVRRLPVEELGEAVYSVDLSNPFNGWYKIGDEHVSAGWRQSSPDLPTTREEVEASEDTEMRKWESKRHVTAAELARRAESLVVIDGWLYEKVAEPAVTLVMDSEQVQVRLTEAVNGGERFSKGKSEYDPSRCLRFGVDETDRAIAMGEDIARRSGAAFVNRVVVESHSPWQVRFRGEQEYLTAIAWKTMRDMTEEISEMDIPFGKAWHDLMTALYEHDAVTMPAVDALRRMAALAEAGSLEKVKAARFNGYLNPGGDSRNAVLDFRMKEVKLALEAWDTRDPQGIEWLEQGLGDVAMYKGKARAFEVTSLMEADALSAAFGRDLADMATAASAGRGYMVAVEDGRVIRTVCFVGEGEDGQSVMESVTSHGAEPPREHLDLALGFVVRAMSRKQAPEADLELAQFGI